MRYIHFWGSTGYCGTNYHELRAFEEEVKDDVINAISEELAQDNARTYAHLVTGWDDNFESKDEEEQYYENIYDYCGYDEVSAEEYQKLLKDYT